MPPAIYGILPIKALMMPHLSELIGIKHPTHLPSPVVPLFIIHFFLWVSPASLLFFSSFLSRLSCSHFPLSFSNFTIWGAT